MLFLHLMLQSWNRSLSLSSCLQSQTNPVAGLCFFNLVVFHQEKVEKQGDGWWCQSFCLWRCDCAQQIQGLLANYQWQGEIFHWVFLKDLFFLVLLLILWFDLSEPCEEIWDLWMWLTSGRAVYWFDLGFRLRFKWD